MSIESRASDFITLSAERIAMLEPGECLAVCLEGLRMVVPQAHLKGPLGPGWTPVDQIMERVCGSSFNILVAEDHITRVVTFQKLTRHEARRLGIRRTYVAPDRRHLYKRVGNLWEPIAQDFHNELMCVPPDEKSAAPGVTEPHRESAGSEAAD